MDWNIRVFLWQIFVFRILHLFVLSESGRAYLPFFVEWNNFWVFCLVQWGLSMSSELCLLSRLITNNREHPEWHVNCVLFFLFFFQQFFENVSVWWSILIIPKMTGVFSSEMRSYGKYLSENHKCPSCWGKKKRILRSFIVSILITGKFQWLYFGKCQSPIFWFYLHLYIVFY